eukprot:11000423-Alexandrium_andersonii.AAC.1
MCLVAPDIVRCTWRPCATFRSLMLCDACAHGIFWCSTLVLCCCTLLPIACIPYFGVRLRCRTCMSSCTASCSARVCAQHCVLALVMRARPAAQALF